MIRDVFLCFITSFFIEAITRNCSIKCHFPLCKLRNVFKVSVNLKCETQMKANLLHNSVTYPRASTTSVEQTYNLATVYKFLGFFFFILSFFHWKMQQPL